MIKKLLKPKVIAITIAVLVVVFVFYWFQLRPSMIRSSCASSSATRTKESGTKGVSKQEAFYDVVYKNCIQKGGLSK